MVRVHRVVLVRAARGAATDDVVAAEDVAAKVDKAAKGARVKVDRVNEPRPGPSTRP